MNISDLQYIESVDASEVQGAGKYTSKYKKYGYFKKSFAKADSTADALAVGDFSKVDTTTESIANADDGVSAASSSSSAVAASKKFYYYH